MTRFLSFALLASLSGPAFAQHGGHDAHAATPQPQAPRQPPSPAPDPHADHRPADQAQADPHAGHGPADQQQVDPHAGHGPAGQTREDPHAGHEPANPTQADPHAGHQMDGPQADPHAGHQASERPAPPLGPPPPAALRGPEHAADSVFGSRTMADAREELRDTHGGLDSYRFGVDQLEIAIGEDSEGYRWEGLHFWYGGDIDKLWLKSEGEGRFGEGFERGEVQTLWSHAIGPWFDLQAGARLEFGRGPERPGLVVGLLGLAPYWFEVDGAVFLSSEGDVSARAEAEYDLRITQRLILQPRVEAELALQDVPELGIGSGVSSLEAGARLRYEIAREFAPYVGVEYERTFGDTARFARASGEDAGGWRLVLGIRAWF